MKYYELHEIESKPGLRLVLTVGMPGPWGLAARALFDFKGVPYLAAAQHPGGDNSRLQALTGQTSAPVALYNDEKPAVLWNEIIYLAERLAPAPRLVSADMLLRAQTFGLIHEIAGPNGFGWCRRLQMFQPMMQSPEPGAMMSELGYKYGYSDASAEAATQRCLNFLAGLAAHLHRQREQGSEYLVGSELSAADIYWAVFAGLLQPLPEQVSPMPPGMRDIYTAPPVLSEHLDAVLIEHRDRIYQRHLSLPLDYLPT